MSADNIVVEFLLLFTLLFFLPRLIHRMHDIPHPLTEVFLGIILGLFAPEWFTQSDTVRVLSTIGIVTLFVYAGLEADTTFIRKRWKVFAETVAMFFILVALLTWGLTAFLAIPIVTAALIALALATPSASFILSVSKNLVSEDKRWVESKSLTMEIIGIVLLALVLSGTDWKRLLLLALTMGTLIVIVPRILRILYRGVFSKLIGTEFPFILAVALMSAALTEAIGLHYLVGAFFAGMVAKRFIEDLAKDRAYAHVTRERGHEIAEGFGFFAATFAPFYFFTVGLQITPDIISWQTVVGAIVAFLIVGALRTAITFYHRSRRILEHPRSSTRIAVLLLPTLVFTFVIAEILHEQYALSDQLFGGLLVYGLVASLVPVVTMLVLERRWGKPKPY
jgi:Kef-type K+ transport system membrane component KefB